MAQYRNHIASDDRVTLKWVLLVTCVIAALSLITQSYIQSSKSPAPSEFISH